MQQLAPQQLKETGSMSSSRHTMHSSSLPHCASMRCQYSRAVGLFSIARGRGVRPLSAYCCSSGGSLTFSIAFGGASLLFRLTRAPLTVLATRLLIVEISVTLK